MYKSILILQAQLIFAALFLVAPIFGHSFWAIHVFFLPITIGEAIVVVLAGLIPARQV